MAVLTLGFSLFMLLSNAGGVFLRDSTAGLTHCICIGEAVPTCGSDGRFYPNECLLDCHNMIMRTNIGIMNEEFCKDDDCNSSCSIKTVPVCGTDGKTYRNMCSLRCARDENLSLNLYEKRQCQPGVNRVKRSNSLYEKLNELRRARKMEQRMQI